MRKGMLILSLALAVSLSLTGCSGNLFMDFAEPPTADLPSNWGALDAQALNSIVDEIENSLDNGAEYSSGEIDEIYTSITGLTAPADYSDPDAPDIVSYEKAQALAGSLKVESDPEAFSIVSNVGDLLVSLDASSDPQPEDLLAALIPADVANDPAQFKAALNTLADAATAFDNLGTSLNSSSNSADLLFEGGQTGDVVQMAMISIVVGTAMDTLGGADPAQDLVDIYTVITDPSSTQVEIDAEMAKLDPGDGTDPFDELTATGNSLAGILNLAGITL